jgi:hypothetical protein
VEKCLILIIFGVCWWLEAPELAVNKLYDGANCRVSCIVVSLCLLFSSTIKPLLFQQSKRLNNDAIQQNISSQFRCHRHSRIKITNNEEFFTGLLNSFNQFSACFKFVLYDNRINILLTFPCTSNFVWILSFIFARFL